MTSSIHIQNFNGKIEAVEIKILDVSDSMEIPYAMVSYCSKMLYSTYISLEKQLNETLDPELYDKLNTVTQKIFDSWIALNFKEGGGNNGSCL